MLEKMYISRRAFTWLARRWGVLFRTEEAARYPDSKIALITVERFIPLFASQRAAVHVGSPDLLNWGLISTSKAGVLSSCFDTDVLEPRTQHLYSISFHPRGASSPINSVGCESSLIAQSALRRAP
jgi:hypothetical protein